MRELKERGVRVVSLKDAWLDTAHPCGEMMISVMAWAAQMERIRLSDRMQPGRMRSKAKGNRLGRKPCLADADQIATERSMGDLGESYQNIANALGCSKSAIARFFQGAK